MIIILYLLAIILNVLPQYALKSKRSEVQMKSK